MELAPVGLDPKTRVFYVKSLAVLNESGVPFLVGGAYALAQHAAIERHTKDLDIFVLPDDRDAVLGASGAAGFRTEVTFPHWLAKAYSDDAFIDRDLQLGQRRRPCRSRMVLARVRWRDSGRAGQVVPRGGNDLVQSLRPGTGAV